MRWGARVATTLALANPKLAGTANARSNVKMKLAGFTVDLQLGPSTLLTTTPAVVVIITVCWVYIKVSAILSTLSSPFEDIEDADGTNNAKDKNRCHNNGSKIPTWLIM